MPSEYEALVAALKLTDIPFAEYGWKTRPEGAYGVVQLDFEAGSLDGDGVKLDRSWEGSIDLFYPKLTDRGDLIEEIEETLAEGPREQLVPEQHPVRDRDRTFPRRVGVPCAEQRRAGDGERTGR